MRKLIFAICIVFFFKTCIADTCPSVAAIKKNEAREWIAYDSDDNTPLSAKRLAHFKKNIIQFALAEWKESQQKENTIHCYYRDKDGSELETYLSRANYIPINSKDYWYQVSGSMNCAAGKEECEFKQKLLPQTQLATK